VPVLTRALETRDLSSGLRASILLGLARMGGAAQTDAFDLERLLRAHLSDPDRDVAETACAALGILGRPSSVPDLAQLLLDSDPGRELCARPSVPDRMRSFSAYALGLLARRTTHPDALRYASHALARAIENRRQVPLEVRVASLVALGRIDASGRPEVGSGCECSSNESLARHLLEVLGDRREETVVRAHVPDALARLCEHVPAELSETVKKDLLAVLSDGREEDLVRRGCVLALGRIADADDQELDRSIRAALSAVAAKERSLRGFVSIALARIGSRSGTGNGSTANANAILTSFVKRLGGGNATEVAWSALALGLLGNGLAEAGRTVPDSLRHALRDGLARSATGELVAAFALAEGLSGDHASLDGIAEKLDDLSGEDLGRAGLALGLLGNVEARETLRDRLEEGRHDPLVLQDLSTALALLEDRKLVEELTGLLDDCSCASSRVSVAMALGRSRDPRAVEPLRKLFEDPRSQDLERACAALSLGALADPDGRRWSAWLSSDLNYLANPASLTSPAAEGILDLP